MLFALDKDRNRVYIDNTHVKQEYFCPMCGEKLVIKKGQVRIHHFAHSSNSKCSDHWHYDMSDWHTRWQSRFPLETQEIVKIKNGQKHRADVLLEDKKVVYEFQHSHLSPVEFDDRNNFYNSLGYKVIWIFDVSEQYENGLIENYMANLYKWLHPKNTFNCFSPKDNQNVELYFEIQLSADENPEIQRIKSSLDDGYELFFDCENYYEEHKDDEKELIKITWAPDNGFERFATDGFLYGEKDIVSRFIKSNKEEKLIRLGDLSDALIEMYSKDHTTYYFGCPRSSSHLCGNSYIDIPDSKYDEIYQCTKCEFLIYDEYHNPRCKKRFVDLGLSENTQIIITKVTKDKFVSQFLYKIKDKKVLVNLPTFTNGLNKSIYTLWNENNYSIAIFKNTRTGKFVKITKNPTAQKAKYGKVYGHFSSDQFSFNGESRILYGCDKTEWICVWCLK